MEQGTTNGFRNYQGGYFRTLISPDQTNNLMALIEFTLPKGSEPPLHVHGNEDESFYVIEGKLSVYVGGTVTVLEPGDALFAPRNTPHFFHILTDTAKILNLITPGTLWNFFIDFSTPVTGEPFISKEVVAPNMEAIQQMLQHISTNYQVNFLETK